MKRLSTETIMPGAALRMLMAGTTFLVGISGTAGHAAGMTETECLAVLTSDAQRKVKADACLELQRVGTADSVPVLAHLLEDEQFAHMARYALEAIRDPSVDDALREALDEVDGRLRIGVIGSIGVRRDAAAGHALAGLLGHPDRGVARAAARALGRIGTTEAAAALENALANGAADIRPAVVEGLLRCAEELAAQGNRDRALEIFDHFRTLGQAPHQVRTAGLRGAVLARGKAGLPLVLEALESDDYTTVTAAARVAQELEGPSVTDALAAALPSLPPDVQVVLASALGLRRDPAAVPGLLALASTGSPAPRVAAVRAMTEIGDPGIMPALLVLQSDGDREVSAAAEAALVALKGPGIDDKLMELLEQDDTPVQRAAIDLIGRRRVHTAVPQLLTLARGGDASLRLDATHVLGDLAGALDLSELVELLLGASAEPELQAAEDALTALCLRLRRLDPSNVTIRRAIYGDLPDGPSRDVTVEVAAMVKSGTYSVQGSNRNFGDPAPGIPKKMLLEYAVHGQVRSETAPENHVVEIQAGAAPPEVSDTLCEALLRASSASKPACLRVLRSVGGEKALATVRGAVDDADPDVRGTAASVLAGWPTVDALPELLALASATPDTRTRILALRGAYRLVPLQTVPDARKLDQINRALALSDRPDEKRLALSTLADMALPESLAVVMPHLQEEAIAEEAGLAAVAIAEKLEATSPARAASAARRVLEVVRNPETRARAQALVLIHTPGARNVPHSPQTTSP